MKKLINLLFVVVCLFTLVGCKKNKEEEDNRPTLTVGMECDYAPFNWTESAKTDTNYPIDGTRLYADGYDVQIAKRIADEAVFNVVAVGKNIKLEDIKVYKI